VPLNLVEREALGKPRSNDRQRQMLIEPTLADVAERHSLR
jgi:hypothetical protein